MPNANIFKTFLVYSSSFIIVYLIVCFFTLFVLTLPCLGEFA